MRIWERRFLWLRSDIPISLKRPWAELGSCPPGSSLGTHPAGPARSHVAAAALGFSTTQYLQQFWELSSSNNNSKLPFRTECSPPCAGLSPLCKSFTVYKGCFHWPRSCSLQGGFSGVMTQDFTQLTFAARGPLTCVYIKKIVLPK